jgi:hypothetical protein
MHARPQVREILVGKKMQRWVLSASTHLSIHQVYEHCFRRPAGLLVIVDGPECNGLLASVETQGRRFSEIDGWTRLSPPDGHTSGNSVFSNRFAFLGSNRFSQSTTLATGLGNGVSPSAFNHCRRQLSGSSHFVPCPSSCHRPPTAISAAKVSAFWRTRPFSFRSGLDEPIIRNRRTINPN